MKTLKIASLTCFIILLGISCENFLEEESKIDKTEDLVYNSAEGIESLAAVCYGYSRGLWGKESMVALGELGTDLWNNAVDPNTAEDFNTYINMGPEMRWNIDQALELFYSAINTTNLAIEYITETDYLSEDRKLHLECETRFLRAFYYWHVVETWGAMQLNKEPIRTAGTISRRDSEQEIYEFMLEDVQYCIDNLPNDEIPSSRVTWLAAKAFKARLALYYASDYYRNVVGVDYKGIDYYAIALQEAQDVIDAGGGFGKSLYSDYADVWDIGNSTTLDNEEVIWAIDYYNVIGPSNLENWIPTRANEDDDGEPALWNGLFTRNPSAGGGNTQHLWLTPRFYTQTHAVGGPSLANLLHRVAGVHDNYTADSDSILVPVDVQYWYVIYMGYGKFGPTRFVQNLFDETVDERWDVTFHTAWYKHPDIVPKYYYSAPEKCLYPNMSVGTQTDTALFYSKHVLTQAQIDWAEGRYKILDVTNTYEADGVTPKKGDESTSTHIFPHFAKFMNPESEIELPAPNFSDYYSKRDFPILRLAEMYLIAAEAALATSGSAAAYPYIEILADARSFSGNGAELLASYDVTGAGDIDLDFILDERAREFIGENVRWLDLKRTLTLEDRVMQHNIEARPYFDPTKHYLRPIPSIQIDASTNKSDIVGEGFWQNPGY